MENNDNKKKFTELLTLVPFLESFPFNEYELELEEEGTDQSDLGISPRLLDTLGSFGQTQHIKFFYSDGASKIMISINVKDIHDVKDQSHKIKEMSCVKSFLDDGIDITSIKKKIICIKKSKDFIKILGLSNLNEPPFDNVLTDLAEIEDIIIDPTLVNALNKLNIKQISKYRIKKEEEKVIINYLNFQLHYAMIILGIVISANIH
jgi:hypothetical protein